MAMREMGYMISYVTDARVNGLWSVQLWWLLWDVIWGRSPGSHSQVFNKCGPGDASVSCVVFHECHLWPLCASVGTQLTLVPNFESPAERSSFHLSFLGHFLALRVWPYLVFNPLQILSIQKWSQSKQINLHVKHLLFFFNYNSIEAKWVLKYPN